MHSEINVTIRTPEGAAWQGQAQALRIPAHVGSFGVLPNHAPMTALTGNGILEIRDHDTTHWFALAAGIADVSGASVTLLTDIAIPASDEGEAFDKLKQVQSASAAVAN